MSLWLKKVNWLWTISSVTSSLSYLMQGIVADIFAGHAARLQTDYFHIGKGCYDLP